MGVHQAQNQLFSYPVNLEHRVRRDHPLRRIAATIDFTFVRAEVAHCYGHTGNVGLDPVVLLKRMFLLFYDNIASEREWMERLPERLDYLWFPGCGLEDAVPDHSVLSKWRAVRRRNGTASRQPLMEGSFAQAANEHGFKRPRWRRLRRQQIQDWLIAAVQNVKILLKATSKRNQGALAQRLVMEIDLSGGAKSFWKLWRLGALWGSC